MIRAALILTLLVFAAPLAAKDIILNLPIDCTLGQDCHVQHYVDHDPGTGVADFTCGALSYDGHKGTDFALPSLAAMKAGVNVLSAAPGRVAAIRNDMPDIKQGAPDAPDVTNAECGNGVLINHGGGWETQYCHMKQGSITVEDGQRVAKGTVLGQVGLSGLTQFPHVHLSVRKDGRVVDPYDADETHSCDHPDRLILWQTGVPYVPAGIIDLGFGVAVPEYAQVKAGIPRRETLSVDAPALVLWVYAFGGQKGDILEMVISGPDGEVVHHQGALEKSQTQFFRAVGWRNKGAGWAAGAYTGAVLLERDGVEIARRSIALEIGG